MRPRARNISVDIRYLVPRPSGVCTPAFDIPFQVDSHQPFAVFICSHAAFISGNRHTPIRTNAVHKILSIPHATGQKSNIRYPELAE